MRQTLLFICLVASPAFAQTADFELADKHLREESNSKACDEFTAFLKASPDSPYAREAHAKRARACMKTGRGGDWYAELQKIATTGEKDFGRAYAAYTIAEQGYIAMSTALPLLKQAASGDDRVAKEARTLFVRGSFLEMDRNSYDRATVLRHVAEVLEVSDRPADQARARLYRARVNVREEKTFSEGEKEMRELGDGKSDLADDALFELGQAFENRQKFVTALELYDTVQKRFSPTTSNVREQAISQAATIRRPSVSLQVSYIEIPGTKPQVSVSYRNVANAKWTLRKVEPMAMSPGEVFSDEERALLGAATSVASTWTSKLAVASPHAFGNTSFDLDARAAGAYMLEVQADGEHDQELVLVTTHATVVKSERDQALTFTADALTGAAVPNADVTLFLRLDNGGADKLTAKADASGVARFDLKGKKVNNVVAWVSGAGSYSYANGYTGSTYNENQEHLGYVLTDRPLYKPGETVGFKVFLRSRADGPSMPVANQKIMLYVRDASGKELAHPELTTNAFGTASFSTVLPDSAQLGQYSMYLQTSSLSLNQAQGSFRVEEYKPPEYTVSVAPVGQPQVGEKVKVKIAASFFFGGPVANAQGRALVQVSGWSHQFGPWPDETVDQDPYNNGYGNYGGPGGYNYRGYYGGYGQFAQHTLTSQDRRRRHGRRDRGARGAWRTRSRACRGSSTRCRSS